MIRLADDLTVDLPTLVDTRLLIQANSGGGKSFCVRRLLEQTHGQVQHLVIDLEGEFASLREKFDYVHAGKDGDTPADPRTAPLLAERLLELKVSAILDIYELRHHDRILFVKRFLDALVNAKKALWHPVLVVVDEAHIYCPQQGEAESAPAVIDLCTRGRKRGFCLPPGELVITSTGLRRIETLSVNDLVLTHTGQLRRVVASTSRPYKGHLLRVKAWGCSIPTTTTPEHEFYIHRTHNNGAGTRVTMDRDWCAAEQLIVGESRDPTRTFTPWIKQSCSPKTISIEYEPRDIQPSSRRGIQRHVLKVFSLPVCDALARIIGWYLAEGSVGYRQHQVGFYLGKVVFNLGRHETSEAAEIASDLETLGLRSCFVRRGSSLRIVVASRGFAELMVGHFGRGAAKKRIPMELLTGLSPTHAEFVLMSYLRGDGCQKHEGFHRATTVSVQLASDLRLLGGRCGWFTSVGVIHTGGLDEIQGRRVMRRPAYGVTFARLPRSGKWTGVPGAACASVRRVEKVEYDGPVYDIEVDGDHSFCTLGHVVHNCAVLATQRLSKLHKDAAAECNNVLIGRSSLDVDTKRAADVLGFSSKEQQQVLRRLDPGEFFAYGPALSREVVRVKIGAVTTTHPKAGGSRIAFAAPPPTAKVKAVLAKLADLPAEVEHRAKTEAELRQEIAGLKRRLAEKPLPAPQAAPKRVEVPVLKDRQIQRLETVLRRFQAAGEKMTGLGTQQNELIAAVLVAIRAVTGAVAVERIPRHDAVYVPKRPSFLKSPPPRLVHQPPPSNGSDPLPAGERKVLASAVQHFATGVTLEQISLMAGYKRSTRNEYVKRLVVRGFLERDGDRLRATDAGAAALGDDYEPLPTGDRLQGYWLSTLPIGEANLLGQLIQRYPATVSRDELGEASGFKRSTRDEYIKRLVVRNLVTADRAGVRVSDTLFG